MARSLNEMYQEVVNMSDEEKVELGIKAAGDVIPFLSKNFKDDDAAALYAMLIGTYVGADGSVNQSEYSYCKVVFGLDMPYDDFFNIVKESCKPEYIELIDNLIDSAPADVKSAFVILGVAIFSCDDSITIDEQRLLAKYID